MRLLFLQLCGSLVLRHFILFSFESVVLGEGEASRVKYREVLQRMSSVFGRVIKKDFPGGGVLGKTQICDVLGS